MKNNIKRIITIALAIAMIAAFAGCSVTGHVTTSTSTTQPQETTAPATPSPEQSTSNAASNSTSTVNTENGTATQQASTSTQTNTSTQQASTSTQANTSTQHATTGQPAAVTTTGATVTLYNSKGTVVVLNGYTDGTWRTSDGTAYSAVNATTWMSNSGSCLYTSKPVSHTTTQHTQTGTHRTGVSFPLYYSDGSTVTVYEYSDGTYRDNSGNYYHKYNAGQWQRDDGTIFGLDRDSAPVIAEPTDVMFTLYTASGDMTYIFEMTDGTYEDFDGYTYHKYNAGQWQRDDGVIFYLGTDDGPSFGSDDYATSNAAPDYDYDDYYTTEEYSDAPQEVYCTGVSFQLYRMNGNGYVTVYEYSDGTYQDSCGMTYHKYNAGQWQSASGELFSLEPVYSTYEDVYTNSYDDYDDCYCM